MARKGNPTACYKPASNLSQCNVSVYFDHSNALSAKVPQHLQVDHITALLDGRLNGDRFRPTTHSITAVETLPDLSNLTDVSKRLANDTAVLYYKEDSPAASVIRPTAVCIGAHDKVHRLSQRGLATRIRHAVAETTKSFPTPCGLYFCFAHDSSPLSTAPEKRMLRLLLTIWIRRRRTAVSCTTLQPSSRIACERRFH